MEIVEKDFKMTLCHGLFWDLELLSEVKAKSGELKQEFKDAGYGLSVDTCIKKIIHNRMSKKQETYSLESFLSEYKNNLQQIKELVK